MFGSEFCDFSFWWLFPLVMIALCFFMMRGRKGGSICGFSSHNEERNLINASDSPMDILENDMPSVRLGKKSKRIRKEA